jgi:hypothetical protein
VADLDAADRLLTKLRAFAESLESEEREVLAALIGPGIARALGGDEVEAFSLGGQESERLARGLVETYRRRGADANDD